MIPNFGLSIGAMSACLIIICLWAGVLGAFWGSRRTFVEFAIVVVAWVALFFGNVPVNILGLGYILLLTNASTVIVSAVANFFWPDSGWKTIALSFMGAAFVIAFVGVFTAYGSSVWFLTVCLFFGALVIMLNPFYKLFDGADFVIALCSAIGLLSLYTKEIFYPIKASGSWLDAARLVIDNYVAHVHWLAQVIG
jgi:hypothetical protein